MIYILTTPISIVSEEKQSNYFYFLFVFYSYIRLNYNIKNHLKIVMTDDAIESFLTK